MDSTRFGLIIGASLLAPALTRRPISIPASAGLVALASSAIPRMNAEAAERNERFAREPRNTRGQTQAEVTAAKTAAQAKRDRKNAQRQAQSKPA